MKRLTGNSTIEPRELAKLAHLRYVSDGKPGYYRRVNGHGFLYFTSRHGRLRDPRELERIEQLAIPPAWTDVWICRFANGHLQATGHDDRKRKQYLYHERWREAANLAKFVRIGEFGQLLPKIRRAIARDLSGTQLTRTRVLAGMVALLDATSIRIGNEEYVRQNDSYGLTTLRTRHVNISRSHAELRFRGKSGVQREVAVDSPKLVRLLKQLKRLRGAHVFQYLDDQGQIHQVASTDVNDYLREITNHQFTAKDFRTWKASALAAGLLFRALDKQTSRERKRAVKATIAKAAELLGNTVTVCRKYYIHGGLLDAYERGGFADLCKGFVWRRKRLFSCDELLLAHLLRSWG
jgi:DNA topoisomerase-1